MRPRVQKPRNQKKASRRQLVQIPAGWGGELKTGVLLPVSFYCFGSVLCPASAKDTNVFGWLKKKKFLKQQNLSVHTLQVKHMVWHDATLRMELISEISFLYSLAML